MRQSVRVRGASERVEIGGRPLLAGDTRLQTQVLESLGGAVRYRRWLAGLAAPYLGAHPVEIGSGNGDYAQEWASGAATFTATEADEQRCEALAERFRGHPVVRTQRLWLGDGATSGESLGEQEGRHTAAVAFNVLEHIVDDVAAVRTMSRLVRPGGAVVLLVPAFPSAMSAFDTAIGHHRRYTRPTLRQTLREAHLNIETIRYVNPVGLVGWYLTVKTLGLWPDDGWLVRLYDRVVVPVARAADRTQVPFGQSVFAVARVAEG
jgi:ubiquinone/menaquinone biosynthesis C-methylase UbiE